MDDDVEQVARMMLDQYGAAAADYSIQQAEAAEAIADELSAGTWRDIADAVRRLQRS
jgi:hypothetical protein